MEDTHPPLADKGARAKYWYLSCTHQRQDIPNPCQGVRIRYANLVELA